MWFMVIPLSLIHFLNLISNPTSPHVVAIQMIILRDEKKRERDANDIREARLLERWPLSLLCAYDTSVCNSCAIHVCVCVCGNMRIDAEH